MTDVGVVVLSMGNRADELRRLLDDVLRQRDVDIDVLVVGNGWEPTGLPAGVRAVALPQNVGVPEGRNVGAEAVQGDIVLFADDDLVLPDDGMFSKVVAEFAADPRLGVLQPRAVDPATGRTARRHVPRVGSRDPDRAGDVAWFWEGCSFVRRSTFEQAGGWPGAFTYGHEGIELAWRAVDAGYRIRYAAEIEVGNPPADPFRRPEHRFMDARNRVWVARRNLPHPLLELYVLVWALATFVRARSFAAAGAAARGFVAGMRQPAGARRPVGWRAVWRMCRLGRPPVM